MTRAAEERVWLAAWDGSYPTVQESSMFQYSSKSNAIGAYRQKDIFGNGVHSSVLPNIPYRKS